MKRLLERCADGSVEVFHFDEMTGEIAIERIEDVEPVLEANKRAQNERDGFSPSRGLREIADIPLAVVELWRTTLGVDVMDRNHWPKVKALLADPDWRWLRSSPGGI